MVTTVTECVHENEAHYVAALLIKNTCDLRVNICSGEILTGEKFSGGDFCFVCFRANTWCLGV